MPKGERGGKISRSRNKDRSSFPMSVVRSPVKTASLRKSREEMYYGKDGELKTGTQLKNARRKVNSEYQANIDFRRVSVIPENIAKTYQKITGLSIDRNVLQPADRKAHILSRHSREELRVLKKHRQSIMGDPDAAYINSQNHNTLVIVKKINGKDFAVAISFRHSNKEIETYEASTFWVRGNRQQMYEGKGEKYLKIFERD